MDFKVLNYIFREDEDKRTIDFENNVIIKENKNLLYSFDNAI